MLKRFTEKLAYLPVANVSVLESYFQDTYLSEVLEILNLELESRADEFASESDRMSWITQKAKLPALDAQCIERILSSAYFCVPYIKNINLWTDYLATGERRWNASIDASLLWFQVVQTGETANIHHFVTNEGRGTGVAKVRGSTYAFEGKQLKDKDFAFYTALSKLAENLKMEVKNNPSFTLEGVLTVVGWRTAHLNQGKNNGVNIGDRYVIGEFVEDGSKGPVFQNCGFLVIDRIISENESRGIRIQGSDWAPGMQVKEIQISNTIVTSSVGVYSYSTDPEYPNFQTSEMLYIGLEMGYECRKNFQWVTCGSVGLTFGNINPAGAGWSIETEESTMGLVLALDESRRFQVGRIRLGISAGISLNRFDFIIDQNVWNQMYSNTAICGQAGVDLDYSINPFQRLSFSIEKYIGSNSKWRNKVYLDNQSPSDVEGKLIDGPDLRRGVLIQLNYSWQLKNSDSDLGNEIRGLIGI